MSRFGGGAPAPALSTDRPPDPRRSVNADKLRHVRARLGGRWLIGLMVASVATALLAAPAAAATEIDIAAGHDGFYVPDRSVPVTVSVTAERLLRGALEVTVRPQGGPAQAGSRVRVPVEVAGGSTKQFLVVAPPARSFGLPGAVASAQLLDNSDDVLAASERHSLQPAGGDELVGLLPGSLDRANPPAAAPLAVGAGVARLVQLGRAEVAQAPASLEALGTIAAGPDDLASLAPPVRRAVLRWLGDGGNLLVDAAPGSPVDGLPPSWQPGPRGHGTAGMGRVRLTDGAMAGDRWDGLVEPTTAGAQGEESLRFGGFGGPASSIGDALAADAGLRVPAIGGLLAFLLVYVVVVGPVTAIVLRRRRRSDLAWIVIPVVAVVFTAGSYVGAEELRGRTKLAHGTALELDALGGKATTFVGIAARGRQATQVSFPGAWAASANPSTLLSGFSGPQRATSVEVTRRGPAARLDLGAGQFGVVSGVGPKRSEGGLEVTATSSDDGQAEGTVRNVMPYALHDAAVFVGSAGVFVGRLGPGEERTWAVAAGRGAEAHFEPTELRVWSSATGRFGRVAEDSVVNLPLWQVTAGRGFVPRPAGVAVAVGWTRDHRPVVMVDGERRRPVGRTAVISRAPVEPTGRITDMAVRGETVRGLGVGGDADLRARRGRHPLTTVRWTLPSGRAPSGDLLATIADGMGGGEVWLDGRWQPLLPVKAGAGTGVAVRGPEAVQRGRAEVVVPVPQPPTTATSGADAPLPHPVVTTTTAPALPPGEAPTPTPPPAVDVGPRIPFGSAGDYVVPGAAVRDGVVFLRLPFAGGPQQATVKLREPAQ